MRKQNMPVMLVCLISTMSVVLSMESEPVKKAGIETLQLVSDHHAIQPGKPFTVGLFIQHLPGYHTYWKAPGIVGVPTTINWDLPDSIEAGEIEWPVPERTKMAQYTAYGYKRDVCLLTEFTVPGELEGESITLRARVAFMCCAKTCHPGWHDFELTIPVNRGESPKLNKKWHREFIEIRSQMPRMIPEQWTIEAVESGQEIRLEVESLSKPFSKADDLYCFFKQNIIDSDKPQRVAWSEDRSQLSFTLVKSGFGPDNLKRFSGLLYHPNGWPGISSKWVAFSVPVSSS